MRNLHTGKQRDTGCQVQTGVLCIDTLVSIISLQASAEVERVGSTSVQIGQSAPFGCIQFHFTLVTACFLLLDGQVMFNGIVDTLFQAPGLLCLDRECAGTKS